MLVINARICTMVDDNEIENGFLFVKDKKIKEVGPMSSCVDFDEDEDVIDAEGMCLFPGFIDAFSYIGINSLDFCDKDANLIAPYLRAIDSVDFNSECFEDALSSGVTSVLISPMSNRFISGQIFISKTCTRSYGDDLILNSLSGIKISLDTIDSFFCTKKIISRMSVIARIREELFRTKKYLEDKKFAISDLEHFESPAYDVGHEALTELMEKDIPAFVSVKSKDEILAAIRLSREFSIKITLVNPLEIYLVDENLLIENNIDVLLSPFSSVEFLNGTSSDIFKALVFLNKTKVPTAIVSSHPFSPVFSLRLAASMAVKEGLDYKEAIKAITINAAKICRIQKRVGSIEIGKDADFTIFKGDPLTSEKPIVTICNGVKYYNKTTSK